jgi:hyperosmotically inducible protein
MHMKKWNGFTKAGIMALGMAALISGMPALAADVDSKDNANVVKPDNTKVNQRDRNKAEVTADQQSNAKQDRELTREIRRAIIKDKSLSSYAHNIKIISRDGMVTLKGPVKSSAERRSVLSKAQAITGGKITDRISVKQQR